MSEVVIENVKSNHYAYGMFPKAVKQSQKLKVWGVGKANVGPRDEAKLIVDVYVIVYFQSLFLCAMKF